MECDGFIRTARTGGEALFIETYLNGKRYFFLVDTGATVSILRPDVAQHCKSTVKKSRYTGLKTASGERIQLDGECRASLRFGAHEFRHSFLVARIRDKAILGLDFLRQIKACINLRNSTIDLPSGKVPLKQRWECVQTILQVKLEEKDDTWLLPILQSTDLPPNSKEWKAFASLLKRFRSATATDGKLVGRTHIVQHSIDTGNSLPIKQAPRRIPFSQGKHVSDLIQEMLEQGVIEESESPWASPVVLVPKKDGSTRFCVDYRQLNKITKKDSYALPCIQDLLAALSGSAWFCVLDLKSGYWQVALRPEDREKTAFSIYQKGLWQFKVMPFGLCNAPATFQRLMEKVIPANLALTYLDDLIIHGPDFETVLGKLERVFECLKKANLQINLKKCTFFKQETRYLGHIISANGVQTDPTKTQAVAEWPTPKTKKELHSFLGFCSYYRRFVKDFAERAKPLTRLTEAHTQFCWDAECEKSFDDLKKSMTSTKLLAFPVLTEPFILDCDASAHGVGAVLSQVHKGEEKVVAYFSRTLSRAEMNYCATRRELLAVVRAIEHFHHYVYGTNFVLRTDHSALIWLTSFKKPEGQLARWLERLQAYDYTIIHRPGKEHSNADGLSRRPCADECRYCQRQEERDGQANSIQILPNQQDLQKEDIAIQQVIQWKLEGKRPDVEQLTASDPRIRQLVSRWELLEVRNGELYHHWLDRGTKRLQWVVPQKMIKNILQLSHDRPTAGHFGYWKTMAKVRQGYFWPGMSSDVRAWCKTCTECQRFKGPGIVKPAPLKQMMVGAPFERMGIDILGPYPATSRGNKYVVVACDYFSKWPEAIPVPNQEAETVATVLVEQVFSRIGIPLEIHTDQGRNFEARLLKEVASILGFHRTRTTPLHPQSAGLVERLNRTLNKHLAMFVNGNQSDWDTKIPLFLMAYRATPHQTTAYSPAQLIYGRDLRLPDMLVRPPAEHPAQIDTSYALDLRTNLESMRRFAQEEAKLKMRTQKEVFDRRARSPPFQEDDWVWVYDPKRKRGVCPKLQPVWTGPWVIVKRRNDVLFDPWWGEPIGDGRWSCPT